MDSYLLTSTRTQCPRPLRPIPLPSPPPPGPFSGWDPRPHLVALGIPPTTAAASRGHPAPLRGYSDPKRNGAFIPWREVCEPFPGWEGTEGTQPSPCSLGAWRCTASDPGIRSHVPSSGSPGDTPVPIALAGHCATLLFCPFTLQELGKRGWSWAGGGSHSLIPTFPTAAFPPRRQLWPLPQSLPCFRGSGRGRAGCDPPSCPLGIPGRRGRAQGGSG